MNLLSYVAAGWWLIGIAILMASTAGTFLQPWIQKRRATNTKQPPISAILPIKLTNPGFKAAQASIFTQAYPDYQVLFSAAESKSPAIDIIAALRAMHPTVDSGIVQSRADFAASPKLNTLATPLAAARHEFILTKDSNIVLAPEMMHALTQNLTPGVGLVCCVPVAENAEGLAGNIEGFLLNGHARLLLTASVLGIGFGIGKVMLFRRSDFARVGGVEAVAYTIAEDTAISKGLAAIGLKTVFAHRTARQEIGRRTLREVFERQLRWGVIRRAHEKFAFHVEPISFPLPAAIAGALAAPLVGVNAALAFALTLGGWFCVETLVAYFKGWQISWLTPAAFLGREILALAAWFRAWTTVRVVWANSNFEVANGARAKVRPQSFALERIAEKWTSFSEKSALRNRALARIFVDPSVPPDRNRR